MQKHEKPDYCDIDWLVKTCLLDDGRLADYYLDAGNRIVDSLIENRKGNWDDGLFLPVAFLYRQALELMLKDVYRLCRKLNETNLSDGPLKRHKLLPLWTSVKPILKDIWEETPGVFADVEAGIDFMERFDPAGTKFRYTTDNSGYPHTSEYPKEIILSELRDQINKSMTFLDGCSAGLGQATDWQESQNDYY